VEAGALNVKHENDLDSRRAMGSHVPAPVAPPAAPREPSPGIAHLEPFSVPPAAPLFQ
jgi:hypothetical protein